MVWIESDPLDRDPTDWIGGGGSAAQLVARGSAGQQLRYGVWRQLTVLAARAGGAARRWRVICGGGSPELTGIGAPGLISVRGNAGEG